MKSSFSDTLSALRRQTGYSQRRVAADLGISQALLSHYENGAREPKLEFVTKACDYYNVTADYILGQTDSRDTQTLPTPCECENTPRLRSAARAIFDTLSAFPDEELCSAAVNCLIIAAENIAGLLHDPDAPHDPMRDVDLKLAEAALIASSRKAWQSRAVRSEE
jgi:transcriptional regulator with XRE-family HTH domain